MHFTTLHRANKLRLPRFRNAKGEVAHDTPGKDEWSPNDWMTAIVGELGEAANLLKKLRRGDFSLDDEIEVKGRRMTARAALASEFADVQIYLELMSDKCGINLGEATRKTFNAKSLEVLEAKDGIIVIDRNGEVKEFFSRAEALACLAEE